MPENIDGMYLIVSNVYIIFLNFITAACLSLFCYSFTARNKKVWLVGFSYFLMIDFLYFIPVVLENFVAYSLALVVAFGVFVLIDQKRIRMKIFLFATFFVLRWIGFAAVGRLENFITLAAQRIIFETLGALHPKLWLAYYLEYIADTAVGAFFSGLVLFLMTRLICRLYRNKQEDLNTKELLFMVFPAGNGMVIYGLFRFYSSLSMDQSTILNYGEHVGADLLWLLCYTIIFAIMIVAISFYQDIKRRKEEESDRLIMENQIKEIRAHITEVEKLYAQIRGVKHDIRNHVEIIGGLLAQGKVEEAKAYTQALSGAVEALDFSAKTGNPVTDVILQEKKREAESYHIDFTNDFHFPMDAGIDAFDVSVILSNALNNAIEAAEEKGGVIKVSSFRNKNTCLFTVENSYEGELVLDPESGVPKTGKGNDKLHGIGFRNMKAVAAKYYGDVQIEQTEGSVVLTVMLQGAGE